MRQSGLHTGAVWLVASSCSLQTTHNKAFGCRMGSKEEVLHASRLFIAVSCLSIKKLLSLCTSCSERGVLPGLPQVVFIHVGKNIFHRRIHTTWSAQTFRGEHVLSCRWMAEKKYDCNTDQGLLLYNTARGCKQSDFVETSKQEER